MSKEAERFRSELSELMRKHQVTLTIGYDFNNQLVEIDYDMKNSCSNELISGYNGEEFDANDIYELKEREEGIESLKKENNCLYKILGSLNFLNENQDTLQHILDVIKENGKEKNND